VDFQVTLILDTTNHTLTIKPLNLEPNIQFDYQALSNLQITLSNLNTSATPAPSINSTGTSFQAINIGSGGTPSLAGPPASGWRFPSAGAYSQGANILTFCTDCPVDLGNKGILMGDTNANGSGATGLYSNAGSSITAGGHQPEILASGVTYTSGTFFSGGVSVNSNPQWVLSVPQLTSTSTVTAVIFGTGTAFNNFATGQNQTPTPEPGSIALMLAGVAAIGVARYRKRST
jgi:hypothetical protein